MTTRRGEKGNDTTGPRNDGEGNETTGNGDDDEGTTHHPPPASRATARGVDRGWIDNDNDEQQGGRTRTNDNTPPAPASRATARGVDCGGYGRQATGGPCPLPLPLPRISRGERFFSSFNYFNNFPPPSPAFRVGRGFLITWYPPPPPPHFVRGGIFFFCF
jgi:hypothetical protein